MTRNSVQHTSTEFQKTRLANGVRVVSETVPSVRSIAVGVWVDAGSRDEDEAECGISHFIEHMVFKGTRRRRMHHIAQRLEAVGGYLNAFTSKEHTCYYARALDEHLDRAIDVVCDLVLQPSFPERELAKEKEVVFEEMKMYEDTPEDVVFDRFESAVYRGHALGRPVLGHPESVRSFSRASLTDYIETRYTPDRIVLAVAGRAAHEEVVRLAEAAFAVSDRSSGSWERTPINGYEPEHVVEQRPIQQAHLVLGARGIPVDHPQRAAMSVLNTILGGGMSSRLNQHIREKYGYCYNVYSFANLHSDTGDIGVYMGADASKVERAKTLIARELDKLAQQPVSQRALSRAINQVKGAIMLGLESMSHRMMRIGRQELYLGQYFTMDEITAELDRVSAEDVQSIAQALFVPEQFSSIVLLPQK